MSILHENGDQIREILLLREDNGKALSERPQDVDEACYSIEEQILLVSEESRTVATVRASTNQLLSPASMSVLTCDDWNVSDGPVAAILMPRGVIAPDRRQDDYFHSDDSFTVPMEMSSPSEPVIPDLDRLLSGRTEEEEEEDEEEEEEEEDEVREHDDLMRTCQQMIQAGYSADQILAELHNPSGSLFDMFDVTADGDEEESSWTPEDCSNVVVVMQMGAQCNDKSCSYVRCQLGQKMVADIEADLENEHVKTALVTRRLLAAIIAHSAICDEPVCSVPWCSFFVRSCEQDQPVEEKCAALQSYYRRMKFIDFEEFNIDIPETSEFIQLDDSVEWPTMSYTRMENNDPRFNAETHEASILIPEPLTPTPLIPRNGIDYRVNGHFGRYGQLGVTALSTNIPPIQLDIIQNVPFECSTNLWHRLRGVKHINVIRHLWACISDDNVTLCRERFYSDGDSLQTMIDKVNPRRIDLMTALNYVAGLASGVLYLNNQGVFYLRWTASGVLMNYNYTMAQLSDFSSAVTSSMIEEDDEVVDVVAHSLPPNILPPEIISTNDSVGQVGSFSEVWGIGCILYHLGNGVPVHYCHRHETAEYISRQVKDFPPEDHVKVIKIREFSDILRRIFTTKENRIDLRSLIDRFTNFLAARTRQRRS